MKRIKFLVKKSVSFSFVFIIIISLASCSQYKVISYPDYENQELSDIGREDSKYIVHQNDNLYVLTDATSDSTSISGNLSPIDGDQVYYTAQNDDKKFKTKEKGVLKEIHVYLNKDASQLNQGQVNIPMKKVEEVKYIKKDMKVFGIVIGGIAVAMFALLLFGN